MMSLHSSFLPKHFVRGSGYCKEKGDQVDESDKSIEPIVCRPLKEIDLDYFTRKADEPIYFSENGKSITVSLSGKIPYISYRFENDNLIATNMRTLIFDYEYRLYDSKREICFIFDSRIVKSFDDEKITKIRLSYVKLNECGELELIKDAFIIECEQSF